MKRPPGFRKLTKSLVLAAAFSIAAAASMNASPPRTCGSCGMFGLARDQVARINAVHIGDPGIRPIAVEMLFVDANGAVLGRRATIDPGQAVFFDLPFDASREENRIEVRPIVNVSAGPDKSLRITIEVFDPLTGKTAVYIGDPNL